ncbi:MAG TPA: HipA family kinase [Acidobacteriaceae bacterium]|nr:HipA family kinase [Acidobacteriaceae bacterium]
MKQKYVPTRATTPAIVSARRFLYKLGGSSQPCIIEGSDDRFYVVKFYRHSGERSLMNEVVGHALIRRLGLPCPDWTPIKVSNDFIDRHPGVWFFSENAPSKPCAGFHFASRLIDAPGEQRTYQMIPHRWIDRIVNRADFLGMLVLDLWANSCDRRQAIYLLGERGFLCASFIDNDSMFGGRFGSETTCPRRAMVYDLDIYRGLRDWRAVKEWFGKIDAIDEDDIREMLASVPDEWSDGEMRRDIMSQLMSRREVLPQLLNDAENVVKYGYSLKYHRARNATEPSRLCTTSVFAARQW